MRLTFEIPDNPSVEAFAAALLAIDYHLPGARLVADPDRLVKNMPPRGNVVDGRMITDDPPVDRP